MEITNDELLEVIKNAPLVSVDIIAKNKEGKILLGLRKNEPAINTWFIPGGHIRKNEGLDSAFRRIVKDELGLDFIKE